MKCAFCKKEAEQLVYLKLIFFRPQLCRACLEAWYMLLQGGRQTVQTLQRSKR